MWSNILECTFFFQFSCNFIMHSLYFSLWKYSRLQDWNMVTHTIIIQWANSPVVLHWILYLVWSHPHLTRGAAHQSRRSKGHLPPRCPPSLHLLLAWAGSPQCKPSRHASGWAQMWGRGRHDPQPAHSTTCDAELNLPPWPERCLVSCFGRAQCRHRKKDKKQRR